MSIKKPIQNIINKLQYVINNPSIYVAALVGAVVGILTGGVVGLFSGGFIGYAFKICNGCAAPLFDINPDITVGAIIGVVLGAAIGGIITGGVTVYKVHKKTHQLPSLSSENIPEVLFGSFWVSIEMSIGMGLGAIIGSLKLPGIGSALGALMGTGLMLFTSTLENKKET